MAGLPPGVSPEMFAASQNTATDGNALHRGDEMPIGTPPFVSGAVTPSGMPHQLAAGAKARADSGVGAGIGGGPSNTINAPSKADAPFDPEGTGPQNYDLSAAPDLRTALVAAMNGQGPNLGKTAPAVVPDPVPASTPDAPPAPSVLPPVQPPSGLGTAGAPVVPPPQGSLTPPPAPAPASDGSLRGDLLAAMQQHDPVGAGLAAGKDVALDPVVPDPVGSLVPPAPSSPNAGLAGPQSDAAIGQRRPGCRPHGGVRRRRAARRRPDAAAGRADAPGHGRSGGRRWPDARPRGHGSTELRGRRADPPRYAHGGDERRHPRVRHAACRFSRGARPRTGPDRGRHAAAVGR